MNLDTNMMYLIIGILSILIVIFVFLNIYLYFAGFKVEQLEAEVEAKKFVAQIPKKRNIIIEEPQDDSEIYVYFRSALYQKKKEKNYVDLKIRTAPFYEDEYLYYRVSPRIRHRTIAENNFKRYVGHQVRAELDQLSKNSEA